MKIREMEVGPELATRWLEGNVHNRKLREDVVARYARDMKAGRWLLTHEPIAFNKNGDTLVDGQHRLWAVVESGATVAPVLTVIARAFYTAERERLTRFAEVLASGTAERVDGEASVIMLRNWLLERSPIHGKGKAISHQVAVYGKTERALSAFLLD